MTRVLENRDPTAVSDVQLAAHASDFVLAGSETSSTCLSTITYYLLRTPTVLRQLQDEVRASFASYSDIDAASTVSLKYMHAVILEGLRIYPPLPFALPRVVPEGGDTVDSHFLPAGASVLPATSNYPYLLKAYRLSSPQIPLPRALTRRTSKILLLSSPRGGLARMRMTLWGRRSHSRLDLEDALVEGELKNNNNRTRY